MSFFGKKPRSAQQKAQWAKTRIMLRAVALGYVVFYIIIPMINPDVEDVEAMHPVLRYGILAFFIIVSAALIIQTIFEFIRNRKAGLYNAEAYEDDEGIESVVETKQESLEENNDDEDYDDEDYDDEDYDDEDYDDEDYDDEDYDDEDYDDEEDDEEID